MAKQQKVFFCQECGYESSKWLGQCPACKEWNTFVEEKISAGAKKQAGRISKQAPASIFSVSTAEDTRIGTGISELDRVLGGGIVKGSLTLVGGDPGIGKSTLLLQVCKNLADMNKKVLYISGEESLQQIKMRAERIGEFKNDMLLFCEVDMDTIENAIINTEPEVVIVDSIQTMAVSDIGSAAGSVSQVREVTSRLMQIAKQNEIAIFIVGHVTKEGTVAGPRTLEHMVDTVLYFEGEKNAIYRVLRGVKNRFGSTNEIGVFEMKQNGLYQVENPSLAMLSGRPLDASGSVVACSMEGSRPILIEIQALVAQTNFNMPRRTSLGIDFNRVNLLMAVLEKKAGLQLGNCDAYINLAGGMKLSEPAIDIGVILSIVSSYKNRAIDSSTIVFGEIGLTGEVRGVGMAEQRVREAAKMGFTKCILPASNVEAIPSIPNMKLLGVSTVREALNMI